MRIDARNLLDRLGRNEFAYREFEDRFSELELWPILEALLRDPRLQAIDEAGEAAAQVAPEQLREDLAKTPLNALFSRYDNAEPGAEAAAGERRGAQPQDVRAMLRRLSELGSRGEL